MRILLIGPGAVGRYIGAALISAGNDVVFGARASTAATLIETGIRLEGPRGTFHIETVNACSDPQTGGDPFDLGISCVKLYDAEPSSREWKPMLQRCRVVFSLQNGIDGPDLIARGAGLKNVYGGMAFVAAELMKDGVVEYQSDMSSITYGGPGATKDLVLCTLDHCLERTQAGLRLESNLVDDVISAQWTKLTGLATNAALTCLVRKPAGVVYHDEHLIALAAQSIAEVAAVGRAAGARIPPEHEEKTLRMLQSFPAQMFASMHHDLAAGRRLELEGLSGAVVRFGKRHGVPTPLHSFAYACLRPHANGYP